LAEHRRQHQRYVNQDRERYNAMAAERIRRKREVVKATIPPVDWQAVVAQRTASRTASLSPEQRREIAAKASKTRWKKYYQRQMLRRMREASA
jgi:isopropylmalate/homocitrate/citramalate synthase